MSHDFNVETHETIKVILYAIATTIIAEFALWILIYRKDEYKKLKADIDSISGKINKQKDALPSINQAKTHEKKTEHQRTEIEGFKPRNDIFQNEINIFNRHFHGNYDFLVRSRISRRCRRQIALRTIFLD